MMKEIETILTTGSFIDWVLADSRGVDSSLRSEEDTKSKTPIYDSILKCKNMFIIENNND